MTRALETPARRVAWAIERSWKTLEDLAAKIGCTHATLSQWQNDHTDLGNAKARLLHAFAVATGTNVHWLLTGDGVAIDRYGDFNNHPLVLRAQEIARSHGELTSTAERLLDAIVPSEGSKPGISGAA